MSIILTKDDLQELVYLLEGTIEKDSDILNSNTEDIKDYVRILDKVEEELQRLEEKEIEKSNRKDTE